MSPDAERVNSEFPSCVLHAVLCEVSGSRGTCQYLLLRSSDQNIPIFFSVRVSKTYSIVRKGKNTFSLLTKFLKINTEAFLAISP